MFDILCWTTEKWDVRGIHKAPYGTPHKSLLRSFKAKEPTSRITARATESGKYLVFEDSERVTGPKVHHVGCFYYKRWLNNPTSTTKWHGPYESEEKAWKLCKEIAQIAVFNLQNTDALRTHNDSARASLLLSILRFSYSFSASVGWIKLYPMHEV